MAPLTSQSPEVSLLLEVNNLRLKEVPLETRVGSRNKLASELKANIDQVSAMTPLTMYSEASATEARAEELASKLELTIYKEKGSRIAYISGIAHALSAIKKQTGAGEFSHFLTQPSDS
ncbi:hypothetical protein HDE_07782 [Halotydeus destructor]|nr:hypothetical protein HDE_07782 [Halotydeus destructor]